MICISVTPKSRTLAPADLLNASRHGDLIELCLDHFLNEPNVAELIRASPKPVVISCRRPKDGGHWSGSEPQRLQLLRSAIVAEPAYVELDLEIAGQILRFGKTQRVISVTSLNHPLSDIDGLFEQCWKAKADVVKFTWPTPDLDSAWPLLAAVTKKREVPVVGYGIGNAGLTFSLLGRRYGSPWTYAALEKGREAFEGEPTVFQLREDYDFDAIGPQTRFLGIVGLGNAENAAARAINAAFREMRKPIRCLPLIPRNLKRLDHMLQVMKINALIVDPGFDGDLTDFIAQGEELVSKSGFMDLVMKRTQGWTAQVTLFRAVDIVGHEAGAAEDWVRRGTVTVCGHSALAKSAVAYFQSQGAAVTLASPSDNAATTAARTSGARYTPWNTVHDVRADTLVLGDPGLPCGFGRGELNPSIIREKMTVVDFTDYPRESSFADEARSRGARYLSPAKIFDEQLREQFRKLAGRDPGEEALHCAHET
jgi:3-dehydroquinate dehydratase/shikimate dehydrogenase